jgi:leucyl aminopeptidase (aminopeptidase T)
MSDMQKMITAAKGAMIHVMDLTRDDKVLVVTDRQTKRIGEAFAQGATEHGCAVKIHLLPENERPLLAVPAAMVDLLQDQTVVINMFQARGAETPFRVEWIKTILAPKTVRLAHGPGITESMLTEGPLNIDYRQLQQMADRLIRSFEKAVSVHITAPAGTDIVLGIAGRSFLSDTKVSPGLGCNLPCGEIYCAPIEDAADGVLVADGSIGDIGSIDSTLRITIRKGKIQKLESEDPELVAEVQRLSGVDQEATVIGELGIGLNPGARICGIMLEDEKALRTAHIAFGNNLDMPGGQNRSRTHRDYLFHRPTFEVTYENGARRILIKDGDIQI